MLTAPRITAIPRNIRSPLTRQAIESRQLLWLKKLFNYTEQHVPMVRDTLKASGLTANDFHTLQCLRQLPVRTKRDYQQRDLSHCLSDIKTPHKLLDRSTSGSTGERLQIKRSWFEERLLNTFYWRAMHSYGYQHTDKMAVIDFRETEDKRDAQLIMNIAKSAGFYQRRVFNGLDDPDIVKKITRYSPTAISGMASAIASLADNLTDSLKRSGNQYQPKFVAPSGELLTTPLRDRIANLQAPIYDMYGCNEVNTIAWSCPAGHDCYHVCDDALIVEILDPEDQPVANDEWGELVVTSLFSYAMPFIRYRTGDIAVRGPDHCQCGATFSTLRKVHGRTIDYFPLPDGKQLHPWQLLNLIRSQMGWIKQFQMNQSRLDEINFLVIPKTRPVDSHKVQNLQNAGSAALAGKAGFKVSVVTSITNRDSGKSRPFIPLT